MHDLFCHECGSAFEAKRPDKLYCRQQCAARAGRIRRGEQTNVTQAGRDCRRCGAHFEIPPPASNRRYCSDGCAREAVREQHRAFHKLNPRRQVEYNARRPYRDIRLARLRRRYPDIADACEATGCGESRVLEIAHKPEHARRGANRLMSNTQRHMFWVLCPTCHKLVDKQICTPAQLGLA